MQNSKAKFPCVGFQWKLGKSFKPLRVFQPNKYRKRGQNVKKGGVWK